MWRGRRWRKLLNLIDRLPRNSAYTEAVFLDDNVAAAILRADDGKEKTARRRMSEWSAEAELLSTVADRIAELIQATYSSRGVKPPVFTPSPRPETALERARYHDRVRRHRELVARVLPHKHEPGGRPPP
jgi:hypothetical protein